MRPTPPLVNFPPSKKLIKSRNTNIFVLRLKRNALRQRLRLSVKLRLVRRRPRNVRLRLRLNVLRDKKNMRSVRQQESLSSRR